MASFQNSLHITCAQKWSLLEDKSNEEEDMANPYFIYCKSHGPSQPPKMEDWYIWLNKRPSLDRSLPARNKGFLSDLPLNYTRFQEGSFPPFSFSFIPVFIPGLLV